MSTSPFMFEPRRFLLMTMLPIGDTILATPTIAALRHAFPRARLVALAYPSNAPVLERVSELDEVVVLPPVARTASVVKTLFQLRRRRFDVSVNFTSPVYWWISLACSVPVRTGMKFDTLWWLIPRERGWWRSTHASRHYYDCAVELGLPPWEQVRRSVPLRLRPEDTGRAHGIIQRAVGTTTGERPVVGLHPGGAGLRGLKRWPAERFAELADRLVECHGARVLLLGGEDDQEVACEVRHRMRHSPAELTGDLSLWDTFALISECDLFIGNDSSLLHAAAALGTPYIGIFGPTHVPNFHPLPRDPDQGVVVQPEVPCHRPQYFVGGSTIWYRQCCEGVCRELASISVDRVFRPAVALLERRQPVREPDM